MILDQSSCWHPADRNQPILSGGGGGEAKPFLSNPGAWIDVNSCSQKGVAVAHMGAKSGSPTIITPLPITAQGPIREPGPISAPVSITDSGPTSADGSMSAPATTTAEGLMPGDGGGTGWNSAATRVQAA